MGREGVERGRGGVERGRKGVERGEERSRKGGGVDYKGRRGGGVCITIFQNHFYPMIYIIVKPRLPDRPSFVKKERELSLIILSTPIL